MLRFGLGLLLVALLAGCGGSTKKLEDGQWFGRVLSVDASQRRIAFAPACHLLYGSGRWVAQDEGARFTIGLASNPILQVYYRPNGRVSAGYAERTNLSRFARIAADGRLPDFSPGWFVAVRGGSVAGVAEESGLRPSGAATRRRLACVSRAAHRYSTLQSHK